MLDKTGVPEISKAVVILHEMSADEEMREIARLREKAALDELSAVNYARKEGEAQGIEKGMAQGIEKGMAQGIEKGRVEQREKILARMSENGFTEEQIRDILG